MLDITCEKEMLAIGEAFGSFIVLQDTLTPFKPKNSIHLSVSFTKGPSREEHKESLHQLLAELSRAAGSSPSRVQGAALLIDTKYEGEWVFHAHAVVRTPKSWRNGRTLSRIPEGEIEAIRNNLIGSTIQWFTTRPVYNLPGLVEYIAVDNIQGPDVVNAEILQLTQETLPA